MVFLDIDFNLLEVPTITVQLSSDDYYFRRGDWKTLAGNSNEVATRPSGEFEWRKFNGSTQLTSVFDVGNLLFINFYVSFRLLRFRPAFANKGEGATMLVEHASKATNNGRAGAWIISRGRH